MVPTLGGRYDVQIEERTSSAVYWEEPIREVRRCSWFYRDDSTMGFIPYSEELSEELEVSYKPDILQITKFALVIRVGVFLVCRHSHQLSVKDPWFGSLQLLNFVQMRSRFVVIAYPSFILLAPMETFFLFNSILGHHVSLDLAACNVMLFHETPAA